MTNFLDQNGKAHALCNDASFKSLAKEIENISTSSLLGHWLLLFLDKYLLGSLLHPKRNIDLPLLRKVSKHEPMVAHMQLGRNTRTRCSVAVDL